MIVKKIPVKDFMEQIVRIYEEGFDYVDIEFVLGDIKDGMVFIKKEDYMDPNFKMGPSPEDDDSLDYEDLI